MCKIGRLSLCRHPHRLSSPPLHPGFISSFPVFFPHPSYSFSSSSLTYMSHSPASLTLSIYGRLPSLPYITSLSLSYTQYPSPTIHPHKNGYNSRRKFIRSKNKLFLCAPTVARPPRLCRVMDGPVYSLRLGVHSHTCNALTHTFQSSDQFCSAALLLLSPLKPIWPWSLPVDSKK